MRVRVLQGDCREILPTLPAESIDCCVTSPPYWGLRDYGVDCQIGLEATPEAFVGQLVGVFREVRRALKPSGTLWLNMGDGYARQGGSGGGAEGRELAHMEGKQRRNCKPPDGLKHKDLIGQPWMLAFALRDDGWYLRAEIIWAKPNPMPESVRDRPTKAHETIFLLSKSPRYFYDAEAISEPNSGKKSGNGYARPHRLSVGGRGQDAQYVPDQPRNARTVWTIPTQPFPESHFAVFPEDLARRCILAGCPAGGTVLDPFAGSGTVGQVAQDLGHSAVLIEANPDYIGMIERRCAQTSLLGGVA